MEYEAKKQQHEAEADGIIEGRNAVIEALRAGDGHRQDLSPEGGDRQDPGPHRLQGPSGRGVWWWRRTGASWTP